MINKTNNLHFNKSPIKKSTDLSNLSTIEIFWESPNVIEMLVFLRHPQLFEWKNETEKLDSVIPWMRE